MAETIETFSSAGNSNFSASNQNDPNKEENAIAQ